MDLAPRRVYSVIIPKFRGKDRRKEEPEIRGKLTAGEGVLGLPYRSTARAALPRGLERVL